MFLNREIVNRAKISPSTILPALKLAIVPIALTKTNARSNMDNVKDRINGILNMKLIAIKNPTITTTLNNFFIKSPPKI